MMDENVSRSLGETSHRFIEGMEKDPLLKPEHKIFLSHSGAQKEFVDHLCQAFENRCHYPFFDRRHESLPKGERFPELIVQAVEQCEMLIVVVSDEYFKSKWPMIELSAFVQAHKLCHESKSSIEGPKILPLFYGLSVGDLGDEGLRTKWFQEWETLAKDDPKNRIVVSDWKYALDVLRCFNGLPYDAKSKEIVAYVNKIVSYVCQSISPDIRWDDSHVQGKSSILKVIGEKIERIGVSRIYKVKVLGIYGIGVIGKTTICKTLCNDLSIKYEGRVCYIQFPSVPSRDSKELFQKVVQDLTRKSVDVIQNLNEGQCKYILHGSLSKQRTFLAIDNFSDSPESIQLAKTMLKLPYHIDSLVVVTARSASVLERLGIDEDGCLEMPDLGVEDAVRLFLQHANGGEEFLEVEEKHNMMTCVERCYFSKGYKRGHHYHPLALQSLGLQLGWHGEHPSLWVKLLPRVRDFNSLPGGNPVFDNLRSGYDLLPSSDQTLLMDLGFFLYRLVSDDMVSILCIVHGQDKEEILWRLEHLKRKGLLQDVDLKSGRVTMHDLYFEFTKIEVKGSLKDSTDLEKWIWVYVENGDLTTLTRTPKDRFWYKLIRLRIIYSNRVPIKVPPGGHIGSLEGIKWEYFAYVETLDLFEVRLEHGALNLEGLVRLRILKVFHVRVIGGIEGLGELKNLTHFRWFCEFGIPIVPLVGQLPLSLKVLDICGRIALVPNALARCHSLVLLLLMDIEVLSLDLSHCSCLKKVSLSYMKKLETLSGLSNRSSFSLQSLKVKDCEDLVYIPGIDHLVGLEKLCVWNNFKCEVPNLLALTNLKVLKLHEPERFVVCFKDIIPRQLRKLCWKSWQSSKGLNLDGFNQLEELDLSWSREVTSLVELGDLPALQVLNLERCEHLVRLPNLSKSRNLKELKLLDCFSLELGGRDIEMLSELPLLRPLLFDDILTRVGDSFRLDLRRGKVHVYQPKRPCSMVDERSECEERDLGPPPIRIGKLGPFFYKR